MNKIKSTKKKENRDCLRCSDVECLNLFAHSDESKNIGKELYVYNLVGLEVDKDQTFALYSCATGDVLFSLCFLVNSLYELDESEILAEVLLQIPRDLKASIFLAFSGHYRQANQVLRCCFENLISALYFQTDVGPIKEEEESHRNKALKKFQDWKKGGDIGDIGPKIEILRRDGFLSRDEETKWKQLYSDLSKFIHTPKEFTSTFQHIEGESHCIAETYFDKATFREWGERYHEISGNIIKSIITFYPSVLKTKDGKVATKNIKKLAKEGLTSYLIDGLT